MRVNKWHPPQRPYTLADNWWFVRAGLGWLLLKWAIQVLPLPDKAFLAQAIATVPTMSAHEAEQRDRPCEL